MPSSRCSRFSSLAHPDAQERVERRERLVEQQDLRVGDQRAGQRHALLLAARELGRQALGEALHVDELEHAACAWRAPLALATPLILQAEGDVVERR